MGRTHSFGYWVRRQRMALDLTQAALAREVGCAPITIRKIEAEERRPSRQMAERLAECLGIPDEERATFVAAARGERAVDSLPLAEQPLQASVGLDGWSGAEQAPAERPPFVAREEELTRLHRHLSAAVEHGEGGIVFVSGEAGRGKSALMAAFARDAQRAHSDLLVAAGTCSAYAGLGDPYLPFRDILHMLYGKARAGQAAGFATPENAERLWRFFPQAIRLLRAHAPGLVGRLISPVALAALGAARGDAPVDWAVQGDSPALQSDTLFEQVTTLLGAISAQQPLLLLLDDLQWADSASLHLLFHIGRRLHGARILLVGAFRPADAASPLEDDTGLTLPEVVNEMQRRYGDVVLDLDRFDLAAGRVFVDALLDAEPNRLDDDFRVRLFWRTRGHPLFTVELLREMRARGDVVRDAGGAWVAGDGIDWEVMPARVEAVIEHRVERLPADLRELLDVASVEGEIFTAQVVAGVQGMGEGDLLAELTELERIGLVRELGESDGPTQRLSRYQFGHILFQAYVYQRLSRAQRRHLHGQVAGELEALHQADLEPVLAQLAHHYAEAGRAAKAVDYMVQAGDKARTLYAHREAAAHFRRAVDLLRGAGERASVARILMKLGLTYQIAFDYERAQQAFDEAFALWPPAANTAALQRAAPGLAGTAPHPLRLLWQDPPSLDPTMGGYNLTAPIANQLFSGLVAYGPGSDILPDVAHRWEIQDDGRRYVFHLRDDVVWSDGVPVTAHDFAFTYRRALDPATQAPIAWQLLDALRGARAYHHGQLDDPGEVGVYAPDDHTLVFELEERTSYFIHNLAYYVLLPVPRHAVEAHGADWASPRTIVTNGPFRLLDWQPEQFIQMERSPDYHGLFTGNLEQVYLVLGEPPAVQVELYAADELDVVSTWFAATSDIAELRQRFPGEYIRRPSFVTRYYFLPTSVPPFDDRRVRRALAMALDRRTLADVYHAGYTEAATGSFVPPGMPGHLPDGGLPFDPAEARRLLAEAGYPDNRDFPAFNLVAYRAATVTARFLHASWEQLLGLKVHLEILEHSQLIERMAHRENDILLGTWWADYPDPDNFLRVDVQMDIPEWQHPAYVALLEQASRSADQDERLELYRQAEHILAEEAPLVPLLYLPFHLMLKPWVKHYPTSAVKNPGFWKDVIIEPH